MGVEVVVGKDQQVLLAAQPGGVQCRDVLRCEDRLEFPVQFFNVPDGVGDSVPGFAFLCAGSGGPAAAAVEVGVDVGVGQGAEGGHRAVEEVQVRAGAHGRQAFPDIGVDFLAFGRGEHVLREAAGQRLRQVEVHVVTAQRGRGDLFRVQQLLEHGVDHVDVRVDDVVVSAFEAFRGQYCGVAVGGLGGGLAVGHAGSLLLALLVLRTPPR
ncbi:hypothetical protein ABH915_004086 [Arthrobacter sp. MW3 TE3886]